MNSSSVIPSCVKLGLQMCAPRVFSRMPRSNAMMTLVAAASNRGKMQTRLLQTGCNQHQLQQHPMELDCSQVAIKSPAIFQSVTDRYKGVHVSLDQLPDSCSLSYFQSLLNGL